MAKLTYHCPICEKQLVLVKELKMEGQTLFEYKCGHFFSKDITTIDKSTLDFNAADGSEKKARHYQEDGIKFILESNFNCIIGDQMRLGKTPQALLALKNKYAERTPALILVRSANLWQWIREYKVWCDSLPNGIFPVIGSNAWIPPGFSAYILSMDTFSRPKVLENLKKIKFKLIIADEAHSFKNTESNRSQALTDFVAFLNTGEIDKTINFTCTRCGEEWKEQAKQKFDKRIGHTVLHKQTKCPKCGQYCYQQQQHDSSEKYSKDPAKAKKLLALSEDQSTTEHERALAKEKLKELEPSASNHNDDKPCGLILLTGTPILNRAEEYFVPLNLVNPEKFSSLERFRSYWLEQDPRTKRYSKVKSRYLDAFKETIKPYILRREKEDVYTDLPQLNKIFTLITPEKDAFAKRYNFILDKMEAKLAEKAHPSFFDMAEDFMELRRICGMMKLPWTADYLESCTMESDAKYAIGIHHQTVRDVLYLNLGAEKNCFKLSGEDNAERKDWIMRNWEHSNKQFLIINMLAGGIGMDFHYCDNVIILERQWNSETESQFEFRFYNPDKSIKKNPTSVEYIIARGTFDEFLYDLIEQKRQIVGETVYNNWDFEQEQDSFRSLVERTLGARL